MCARSRGCTRRAVRQMAGFPRTSHTHPALPRTALGKGTPSCTHGSCLPCPIPPEGRERREEGGKFPAGSTLFIFFFFFVFRADIQRSCSPWCDGVAVPGPAALPEPRTALGAGQCGGMPWGARESLSPQNWGQKQIFNSKIGASQRNHHQSSPKGGSSASNQDAQPQPSQTAGVFWLELVQLCPLFPPGLRGQYLG